MSHIFTWFVYRLLFVSFSRIPYRAHSFSLGMDLLPPAVIPILMKRDVQSKLHVKDLLSESDLRELNKSLATLIPKTNASLEGQAFQ